MSQYPKRFEHYDMARGMFRHTCQICQCAIYSRRRTGVRFCGAKCRKRASNGHRDFKTDFTCKNCGKTGFTVQPFQHPEYCSNACRQAAYRKRRDKMLQPVHTFSPGGGMSELYCDYCANLLALDGLCTVCGAGGIG